MPSPVRIALLGNSFAEAIQLPALRHAGKNEVIGIAGGDRAKAERTAREWNIPCATNEWRELIDLKPDLVLVSTPVDMHFEMARAALESGAAVLCEKPFTLDASEAATLTSLADGKLALLDHQLRWSPLRRHMRQLLEAGYVGQLFNIRADLVIDSPAFLERPHSWWFQAERGGGVLGALASHLIDNLLWMFGPIDSVSARLDTFVKQRPDADGKLQPVSADDTAELWLKLASGASVSMTTSVVLPGASRSLLEVTGSAGTLRLDLEDDLIGGKHGEDMAPLGEDLDLPLPETYGMRGGGGFAACEPLFLREVIDAVAAGRTQLAEAATFADGLACMKILDAARRSSAGNGAWVPCR